MASGCLPPSGTPVGKEMESVNKDVYSANNWSQYFFVSRCTKYYLDFWVDHFHYWTQMCSWYCLLFDSLKCTWQLLCQVIFCLSQGFMWLLFWCSPLFWHKNKAHALCIDCYLVADTSELPDPACVIEERPEVKAVVIRAVALSVVGWCHRGHFVAVHWVHAEEVFHLLGHLNKNDNLFLGIVTFKSC